MNTSKIIHPLLVGTVLFLFIINRSRAQDAAPVSSLFVFGTTGTVTTGEQNKVIRVAPSGKMGSAMEESGGKKATNPLLAAAKGEAKKVLPGVILKTGADGNAAVVLPGAGSILLGPNTEVRLPKADDKTHSLELLKGNLFINISAEEIKRGAAPFRLKTPAAVLAVKGTQFFVSQEEPGEKLTTGVHQGAIEVNLPGDNQATTLLKNQALEITAGKMGSPRVLNADEKADELRYTMIEVRRVPVAIQWASVGVGSKIIDGEALRSAVPGTGVLRCQVNPKWMIENGRSVRDQRIKMEIKSTVVGKVIGMELMLRNWNLPGYTFTSEIDNVRLKDWEPEETPIGADAWSDWRVDTHSLFTIPVPSVPTIPPVVPGAPTPPKPPVQVSTPAEHFRLTKLGKVLRGEINFGADPDNAANAVDKSKAYIFEIGSVSLLVLPD